MSSVCNYILNVNIILERKDMKLIKLSTHINIHIGCVLEKSVTKVI